MKLPKWLRHWAALFLSWRDNEAGGYLYDYANGKWEEIHKWNTQKGSDEGISITVAMFDGGKDAIYIAVIRCPNPGTGYFVVHDSNRKVYIRGFWIGIYEPKEAFKDIAIHCRKVADKMGFRNPDAG
jgi:hypothetical protein